MPGLWKFPNSPAHTASQVMLENRCCDWPLHLQQIVTMWGNLRKLHLLVFWEKMEVFGKGSSFQFLDNHKWSKNIFNKTPHQVKHNLPTGQVGQTFPSLLLMWTGDKNILSFSALAVTTPRMVVLLSSSWMAKLRNRETANGQWGTLTVKSKDISGCMWTPTNFRSSQQFQNPNSLSSVWISTYVLEI